MASTLLTPGTHYYLINKESGKALDVVAHSKVDGANVQQWTKNQGENQQWLLQDAGNGSFNLVNKESGKALDVVAHSKIDGANVQQWTKNQGENQQWLVQDAGNGSFNLVNKESGKALEVAAHSKIDGANVQQWTKNQGENQKWIFEAVTSSSSSHSNSVKLEYRIKGKNEAIIKKDCELLIVACDPRNLSKICDYTPTELGIFGKLINFTFHTSLLQVEVKSPQKHAVIFAPHSLDVMDGSVYAFRNESAKQFGIEVANGMKQNLVTVYQLVDEKNPLSASDFEKILKQQLTDSNWWPFSNDYKILETVTTPYFDHFSNEDLKKGLPWELLKLQGQNNTLYVHGFTCFESALHCWDYGELMLNTVDSARHALPTNLEAPIVILGAGVSGLLFAVRLKRLGYTNIEILESTDRYCGKTHTFIKDGPYPSGSTEKTVCELGTCYLSPAYSKMTKDLEKFLEGNDQIDFVKNNPNFRGIVTTGEFPPTFQVDTIIEYPKYILFKALALLGLPQDFDPNKLQLKIAVDLIRYNILHWEIMGQQSPMPPEPPTALLEKTFYEFLKDNHLLSLVGMMDYIYAVQGYGVMKSIPAYYALIWITPIVIETILLDNLSKENKPVITAFKNGWGNLWDQIVTKEKLNIIYSAETTSIKRKS
ncbi:RICIN domain-containing protein [Nostoc sp. CCCryo 231-06]|nr:RICIN domain-containing protein [Nostoc sp. CCCryo 231-06]